MYRPRRRSTSCTALVIGDYTSDLVNEGQDWGFDGDTWQCRARRIAHHSAMEPLCHLC